MIAFANAKINIGLQVVSRREDGYHNLETIFYPLNLYDVVEVVEASEVQFSLSGIPIPASVGENLCLQAYRLLASDFKLPPVHIYLHKVIPIGAGLGGGSADAAFLLKLLNDQFQLQLDEPRLMGYARRLGADCPFFIRNRPSFATGIGDVLDDIAVDLSAYHIVVVKPHIHIATETAYRMVTPDPAGRQLRSAIAHPVASWKDMIFNDFEAGIFSKHPEIAAIKEMLYGYGALFASMSGSGSAVYGIFSEKVSIPASAKQYDVFQLD
ncbi:4-(cytidine 5'-diphospho)-2-C-methyl-D-erythritol kinase [Parapedobacter lycopersici]|uniref:4-(cytidine 5'-diphospho)-2-C-methyl-D-erythritol kinase n=1 Tax=Parapedobacter lycopersici TaxID=1864939 RepID=UPI00214D4291|nr:4-(cytidine 5'-diphospho)-2-C-methyl-D-erythritol kinase [Parapedobacter lycopersici]